MLELHKPSIDLGIIVRNLDACRHFYGDVIGLPLEAVIDMPNGAAMHRYLCGESVIKLLALPNTPERANPPGGFTGATGLRYWTIPIKNLEAVESACQSAGASIPVPISRVRPGVRMFVVEDPDGNWLEFVQYD